MIQAKPAKVSARRGYAPEVMTGGGERGAAGDNRRQLGFALPPSLTPGAFSS